MFTGNTIPLDKFSGTFGLKVLRNCDFSFVGKVPTRLDRRVVPCKAPSHIEAALKSEGVAGIVTTEELATTVPETLGVAVAEKPILATLLLQDHISEIEGFQWKNFDSRIDPTAVIYPGAYVAEKDVEIGAGTVVYPNAVIMPRSIIGKHCSIGPGTVVCGDAFEVNTENAPQSVVRQSGGVRLADHVDVQSKCTLVRATFGGFTELGEETKFDCQVHFAHDCVTGKGVRIAACAEISGRVEIGDDAFVGPNASVSNGITIGARAHVTIGAVVTRDVADDVTVTGNFAVEHRKWLSFMRSIK